MNPDRPLLGIGLMLCFCAIIPLGDALAKLLGGIIPLLQLVIVRFGMQAVLLLPIIWIAGGSFSMPRWVFKLSIIRAVLHVLGVGGMFLSLQYLPLADAVAIAFVMPFIMLLLGKYVLGEEVGVRRLAACAVGFLGTMLVIQPSFAEVGLPALIPLFVAFVFALFMLVTRKIAKHCDPVGLQCVSGGISVAVLTLVYLVIRVFDVPGVYFVMPDYNSGWLLICLGVVGSFAHLLMTWSLRLAPSATLAPMQYLEIPVATLLGWLIFNDLPNHLAAVGILITILSGLYVVLRERSVARSA